MIPVNKYVDAYGFFHFSTNSAERDSPLIEDKSLLSRVQREGSVQANQGLYEEVLLTSSSQSLKGGKDSPILYFMHHFFSLYPSAPAQFLSELYQAAKWAEALEAIMAASLTPEASLNKRNELVLEVSNRIKGLNKGEGCIISGGTHCIFRILKMEENKYSLKPFSRAADLEEFEHAHPGGREKNRRVTFEGLSLEDIADTDFIAKLLQLSQKGKHSIGDVNAIFNEFKNKIVKNDKEKFHLVKSSICRFQSLWDLLHEGYDVKQTNSQKGRQKLEVQMKVFLDYFESAKTTLSKDTIAFKYLRDGLKILSRNNLLAYSKGQLSGTEIDLVYKKLDKVDEELRQIVKTGYAYQMYNYFPPSSVRLQITSTPLHIPKVGAMDSIEKNKDLNTKLLTSTPYLFLDKQYSLKIKPQVDIDAGSCLGQLDILLAHLTKSDLLPLQREQAAVDFCFALPLAPSSKDDVWSAISMADRAQASKKLAEISSSLLVLMKLTGSNAPNRILALVKITVLSEHLARLNQEQTKFENHMFCAELFFLITDLLRGSGGYHQSNRVLLGHSVYPPHSPLEEAVLGELKSYYEWLSSRNGIFSSYIRDFSLESERSDYRHDDREGGIHGWSAWNGDKSIGRDDVEVDLTKKPYKDNLQCQHLQTMLENLRLEVKANEKISLGIIQSYMRGGLSFPSPMLLAGTYHRWGRTIRNPLLSAVFYAFSPEKGKLDPFALFSFDSNTFTQEAIMDDPWLAIERAFENWQKDLASDHPLKKKSYLQVAYTAKPELLQYFSENDLRDLLLALEPVSGVWNILGLIKKNPVFLKNTDFQAIAERMVLQPKIIENTLKIDPKFPEFLGPFFETHIQQLERIKEIPAALFMVHLFNAIIKKIPSERIPEKLPAFMQSLRRWCYDALKPNSEWTSHRYGLLSELLVQMGAQKDLSHQEIKEFVILRCLWEDTPALNDFDPAQADLIRKQYFQWMPQIEQALNDSPKQNILQHIVEEIAGTKGINFDKSAQWNGIFPVYSIKEWEVDLTTGIFKNLQNTPVAVSLPPHILNDPLFQEAFPDFSQHSFSCYSSYHQGITYYHFEDSHHTENLIEKTPEGICIYKSNPLDQTRWIQYVSVEKKSINELGAIGLNNSLYISLDNRKEAFLFNIQGEPEFNLVLQNHVGATTSEVVVNSILNVNPKRCQSSELQGTLMDPAVHEGLKFLLSLAKASEILIWTQNSKLHSVEFYGLGLTFIFTEGDLVCDTKPLLGYKMEVEDYPPYGLPAGLVLLPPDKTQAPQWILPYFSGQYEIKKPDNSSSLVNKAAKYLWNASWSYMGYKAKEADPASIERLYWKFDSLPSKGFWSFPDPSQSCKSYFDLFKYALCASQANVAQAIVGAKECLQKIREIPLGKVSEKDMEAFAREMAHRASTRSKIASKPHPETVALAIHGLLVIKDKGSPAFCSKIEQHLSKLIPLYFNRGKQIQLKALLDEKQELSCLMLMKTYDSKWFQEHALLLSTRKEQVLSIALKDENSSSLSSAAPSSSNQPPPPLKVSGDETLSYFIKAKTFDLASFKEPEAMAVDFMSILELADDPETPIFKKTHRLIKKLAEQTHEQKDAREEIVRLTGGEVKRHAPGHISISYKSNFQDKIRLFKYLEVIFNIKSFHPHLKIPHLIGTDTASVEAFCKDLTSFVESNFHLLQRDKAKQATDGMENTKLAETLEQILKNPLLPLESLTIESGLEKRLLEASPKSSKNRPAISLQKGDALFSPEALRAYFDISTTCDSFDLLALDKLANAEEPSVQMAAKKLQNEIKDIKKDGSATTYQFKKKEAVTQVMAKLEAMKAPLIQQQEKLKKSLEKKLEPSLTPVFQLQVLAGYTRSVSWDELIVAFLQQDLDSLIAHLPAHVDIQTMKNELTAYLKIDVKVKSIKRAFDELVELQQDPALIQSLNAGSKIYELLSRERCFDPAKNPELLAMESLFGFMIREDQLKMVMDFIESPHCIRQASTGAGKTNVILPLVALMKANGHNLVSLKFLDPLFNESFERLQKLLGFSLQKKVFPLLFSGETPLVCEKIINRNREKQSIFKYFYEESIKTILNKGCLITNKKSQPLLKAKMIEIYDRLAQMSPSDRPAMDLEHLQYLGKLLCLFKEREETLYDEFDKFLSAREELHLRIGQGKPLASFVSETIMGIYDLLVKNKDLNISENTQAELPKKMQLEIMNQITEALSGEWQKKGISVEKYLKGTLSESEEILFLKAIEGKLSSQELDTLSLQKDLMIEFIRSTLFKSADQRYIRSKLDEKSVIPCDYADMPKEGSEFEDIRVKLCYMIQYYYQKGPSFAFFNQWINGLKSQAIESLIAGEAPHISKTTSEKIFKDYFPEATLEGITQDAIPLLYKKVKRSPILIRKFLNVLTQEQKLPGKKISLNPHNQVSIAKASAGTSATKGCLEGLHRGFIIDDKTSNSNAKMISRLLQRMDPKEPVLTFDQKYPKKIIFELLQQDKKLKVVIDGAGALRGMSFDKPAKQLLEHQRELKVAGYFDQKGRRHHVGDSSVSDNDIGLVYSNAQARGADARLSVHHKAVLLVNGRSSQEEVSQNEGRLRKEDQKLRIAVPKGSEIQNIGDLINATLAAEAKEKSIDLFLSKQQEMQDFVHEEMTATLAKHASNGDFVQGFKSYTTFAPSQLLVSEFAEKWDLPGSYYNQHKHIKRTKDPVSVLELTKDKLLQIANRCSLTHSEEELKKLDLEKFRPQLPLEVSGDMKANQEVQIETETQTEVQTEVETEVDIDTEAEKPPAAFYLPWNWHNDYGSNKINQFQSAYDEAVYLTSHYLPMSRNRSAPSAHQRLPHDPRQNRLVHAILGWQAVAQDVKDVSELCFNKLENKTYSRSFNLYDTRLNRFIHEGEEREIKSLENNDAEQSMLSEDPLKPYRLWKTLANDGKKNLFIAQLRFEDGQYKGYTEGEWKALKWWVSQQKNPKELEDYFVNEVLKHRPQDRERYLFSPLQEVFQKVQSKK
jgi:Protein of unknown function (DUF3638)